MLFTANKISENEMNDINNFFNDFEEVKTVAPEEASAETPVSKYVSSLVTACYQKSVQEIENTKIGNRIIRKRNLQQVMQESFFLGANRFGNNYIA